jgi:hypothetical protein
VSAGLWQLLRRFGLAGGLWLCCVAALPLQGGRIDPVLDDAVPVEGEAAPGAGPEAGPAGESSAPADRAAHSAPPAPAPAPDPYTLRLEALERQFDAGVAAWRAGEYELARGRWLEVLAELEAHPTSTRGRALHFDRHALLHDLGNAAFRLERPLEAVGWYLAALRHAPRERETLGNLQLARRAAELEPEGEGDFLGSLLASLGLLTPAESRFLVWIGLVPLLLGLLGEAIRGGRGWRTVAWLGALTAALCTLPLARHLWLGDSDPLLVIAEQRVEYRAEPLPERPATGALEPGQRVERLDQLPDWVRIETADGARGWVPAETVFALHR